MADIIPFRGVFYNPKTIQNMADVTTPPYDIIKKHQQQDFYKRHPNNIIRLILNKPTEAAYFFEKWLSENILIQDNSPAFYLISVKFSLKNKTITRFGLIALVRLESFEKGVILPHEKTFSKVKSERFELIKTCKANFSPIFSLFSDQDGVLDSLKQTVSNKKADINFIDSNGDKHNLWRIIDTDTHKNICNSLKSKNIFIADGHHRYETALNYKNQMSDIDSNFSDNHPANYVMMYLTDVNESGLIILPSHRMIKSPKNFKIDSFIQKAEKYFDISTICFAEQERKKTLNEFISILKKESHGNTFGVYIKSNLKFHILTIKSKVMQEMFDGKIEDSLSSLDTTILTRVVFMEIFGFDQAQLDDEKTISYSSCEKQAIAETASGKFDIAFILNPTKINQVCSVAQQGLIMPRKSTYFYPKVITGLTLNKLY